MRFLKFRYGFISVIVVLMILVSGCKAKVRKLKSPPHYNFAEHGTYKLDLKLKEISGIAWEPKEDVFVAINDEKGSLFYLNEEVMIPPKEFSFGGKGDYEDVALIDGVPYILRSDGQITKFVRDDSSKVYGVEAGKIALSGTNDFESMYYDPGRRALIVICKKCAKDDKGSVSAFAFYPDSIGFVTEPVFIIDANKVDQLSPYKASKFQPSAAAINPVLQKVFILSSSSHQLAITDLDGKVESVYVLSKKIFPQPEGITFRKNGDMYISNEGIGGKSTLLQFAYIDSSKTEISKAGYNFDTPDERMELSKDLHEISGMAYIPGKNIILAHGDEKGNIYTVDFKNKDNNFGKVKFSGKGDYEDIVYTDSADYLLMSTGGIVKVLTEDSLIVPKEFTLPIEGKNEFETLYKDKDGSLVMLCKECDHEKDKVRTAYKFDPKTGQFSIEPLYRINIGEIQKMVNDDKAEFKPSAAGINPVNGKLYIIASVGKLLAVYDKDMKLESVFHLDPVLYNQPEGLTFAPNGDLYISNEGGEGIARIYKFNYKKR